MNFWCHEFSKKNKEKIWKISVLESKSFFGRLRHQNFILKLTDLFPEQYANDDGIKNSKLLVIRL